ncbi:TetR/AcrR family transcriptional regulator [Nocardioides sp.]|uniref:TetR/AcrR family transcriptional regulator n=1 Tax=Nocardioides sp. TaxID=35761 RepID=UPI003515499D
MTARRTQAERTAATRAALVAAARPLFAARGFAGVGTDELASAAGVTRGALYHQFGGKEGLFEAVVQAVHGDVVDRLASALGTGPQLDEGPGQPVPADLGSVIDAWLEVCTDDEVLQIALLEAPTALGWWRSREIARGNGMDLAAAVVQRIIDAGGVPAQPVWPLTHVLVAALEEGALMVARAEDRVAAAAEVRTALRTILDALLRT